MTAGPLPFLLPLLDEVCFFWNFWECMLAPARVTVMVATGEAPAVGEMSFDREEIEYCGESMRVPEFYLDVTAFYCAGCLLTLFLNSTWFRDESPWVRGWLSIII